MIETILQVNYTFCRGQLVISNKTLEETKGMMTNLISPKS